MFPLVLASVCSPYTRCKKLEKMAVRVAEVNTPAAPGPGYAAENLNAVSLEMRFPFQQLLFGHCKSDVYGA